MESWIIEDNEETGEEQSLIVDGDSGALIADCYPSSAMNYALPEDYRANARKVAAAPDLLAALELAKNHLSPFHQHDREGNEVEDCISCAKVSAAITKAKGGA